ncbi:MAG: hypothetical protein MUE70_16050, partial [Desulfobacterales bacterium]|nr:hypothetical protein [Desulfobacterales bacterium]
DHLEFDTVIFHFVDSVVKSKDHFVNNWEKGLNAILDHYLGVLPTNFKWKDKVYSPLEFSKFLDIKFSDYIKYYAYACEFRRLCCK